MSVTDHEYLLAKGRFKGSAALVRTEIAKVLPALINPAIPWPSAHTALLYGHPERFENAAHCLGCWRIFEAGPRGTRLYCSSSCQGYASDRRRYASTHQTPEWTTCVAGCGTLFRNLSPNTSRNSTAHRLLCPAATQPGADLSWWSSPSPCAGTPAAIEAIKRLRRRERHDNVAAAGGDARHHRLLTERGALVNLGSDVERWIKARKALDVEAKARICTDTGRAAEEMEEIAAAWIGFAAHLEECADKTGRACAGTMGGDDATSRQAHRHKFVFRLAVDGELGSWVARQAKAAILRQDAMAGRSRPAGAKQAA